MNILLISQCTKNALTETRRILDQFAERCGDRAWQTAITQQGLETLYRLLRKTARKNTAVACHWFRGKDHTELLWIVGDRRRFNTQGAVPTNTTARDVLRNDDENDWHTLEDIRLLACLAALFHDFGKANTAFQKKLTSAKAMADAYRHEWVSLRLFESFVRHSGTTDRDWLTRLADLPDSAEADCLRLVQADSATPNKTVRPPLYGLPPLAQAVGWLIVSHHRLPIIESFNAGSLQRLQQDIAADWCGSRPQEASAKLCWEFKNGLPFAGRRWREHAARLASAILRRPNLTDDQADRHTRSPFILHLARLALVLADHHYSSQDSQPWRGDPPKKKSARLYANTRKDQNQRRQLNQLLDEHLIGVEVSASRLIRSLPRLERTLPPLSDGRRFRQRSQGAFRWQNRAFECVESVRERAADLGFFGVNMASTGCGKTLANARIGYALANPRLGARFTVALGLRTLTLQTGEAYRQRLQISEADLAVLVGGGAVGTLHAHYLSKRAQHSRDSGSESSSPLLPEHQFVHYAGSLEDGPLKAWLGERTHAARLLDAPVLVCTIDHLMPATESLRGGHQIAPMLRLLTSDLILDEPDDFGLEDLPALSRLVHWAGLLGSRVLLSSATLPPALVQGLFLAYRAGRAEYRRNRGRPDERTAICCAWFDEFDAQAEDLDGADAYLSVHHRFVEQRLKQLADTTRHGVRRRARIQPLDIAPGQARDAVCAALAKPLREQIGALHRFHHTTDPKTGKRVSFGLIRLANIDPLFDVARELFRLGGDDSLRIHLCVYHSRHPLLVRAAIEHELDAVLNRTNEPAVFDWPSVRQRLDGRPEPDHSFVVLASPVAEVGRDHDYDWAIVEPSSMRSIIQLAGRVRRHRDGPCPEDQPNLCLLDTNIKHLISAGKLPAFLRPGFESKDAQDFQLAHHRLNEILTPEQWRIIDAGARIRERDLLQPKANLVDLEQARLRDLMLGADPGAMQVQTPVHRWWTTQAHLSGALQRQSPFRKQDQYQRTYALLPTDDETIGFFCLDTDQGVVDRGLSPSGQAHPIELVLGPHIDVWAVPEYPTALEALAEALGMEARSCAEAYGTLELPEQSPGSETRQCWRYHWALGFSRDRVGRG